MNNGTPAFAYGFKAVVPSDNYKAFAVVNLNRNTCNVGGDDVFRVMGNGYVHAREVKVFLNGWCDYVFADDYELRPLAEVEKFIKENHHLPDVPSEKTVLENGVDVGDMEAVLLRKVEELTLYSIELKKELDQIKKQLEEVSQTK